MSDTQNLDGLLRWRCIGPFRGGACYDRRGKASTTRSIASRSASRFAEGWGKVRMTPVRDRIHRLVDQLPEAELPEVESLLAARRAAADPVLQALANAPAGAESVTEEEAFAIQEGFDAIARGEVVSDAELDELLRR